MHMLDRLAWSDFFETFLANKYTAAKRFGLEGAESLIPGMKTIIDTAADMGVNSVVIGMPHRGGWYHQIKQPIQGTVGAIDSAVVIGIPRDRRVSGVAMWEASEQCAQTWASWVVLTGRAWGRGAGTCRTGLGICAWAELVGGEGHGAGCTPYAEAGAAGGNAHAVGRGQPGGGTTGATWRRVVAIVAEGCKPADWPHHISRVMSLRALPRCPQASSTCLPT